MRLYSVIIPTCQRNERLASCLELLGPRAQKDAPDYEVIVTDDGRRSTARNMIESRFPWAKWSQGPARGPAANRNSGARQATGDWLVFCDDDCLPEPGWLAAIERAVEQHRPDVVEGKTVCPGKTNGIFEEQVENLTGGQYWSCNLALRASVFWSVGPFDEDFREAGGEDMELAWRLRKSGLKLMFAPEAIVQHPPRTLNFRQFIWRQRMAKWICLYQLKTEKGSGLNDGSFKVARRFAANRILDLFRVTWRAMKQWRRWNRRSALLLLDWILFPVQFAYQLYWEFQFRSQMREANLKRSRNAH